MSDSKMVDVRIKKLELLEKFEALEKEKMGLSDLNADYLDMINKESNNWDLYKNPKGRKKIIKNAEKRKKFYNMSLINKNKNLLIKLKINTKNRENLSYYESTYSVKKSFYSFNLYNNKKIIYILNLYSNLNLKKFNQIKKENYFNNFIKHMIIIFDLRNTKPRIFIINNNKCVFTLTSGIIYKKMQMKEKKIKKTEKMFNIMVKTTIMNLKKRFNCKKFIVNVIGTRYNLSNSVLYIKKNFDNKNIIFLYSPSINHNNLKVKKVKSIKRRLKKRIIKYK